MGDLVHVKAQALIFSRIAEGHSLGFTRTPAGRRVHMGLEHQAVVLMHGPHLDLSLLSLSHCWGSHYCSLALHKPSESFSHYWKLTFIQNLYQVPGQALS